MKRIITGAEIEIGVGAADCKDGFECHCGIFEKPAN
jgi:hypothetical protein